MFYNSKKLIDEKVLQQYFYETIMLAGAAELKKLIPPIYQKYFKSVRDIKGLQPEVKLEKSGEKSHITDFVLYHINPSVKPINIEIKWKKEDFETWRYPYYNGEISNGFLVCLEDRSNEPYIKDTSIPIIFLNITDFKKWFTVNANNIITQALSNKLSLSPERLSGCKYWVVVIPEKSFEHYNGFGKKNLIWAFRNNNNPRNIINILENDYIIFVKFAALKPGRLVHPLYNNLTKRIPTVRGNHVYSKDIEWSLEFIDIYRIKKGYHLDFSDTALYSGFESSEWKRNPSEKEYTQYILLKKPDNQDLYCSNNGNQSTTRLSRELFPETNQHLSDFVHAMRLSLNNHGDAVEINYESFQALQQLLNS